MTGIQKNESDNNGILLSLIIPAYNEESTIEHTLGETVKYLSARQYGWEIIVVDDASTDATVERVKLFISSHRGAKVNLIVNEHNSKKGASIKRGVLAAEGKYSVFMDADYAYPITQLSSFLEPLLNGADIVIGNRTDPGTTYIVRPVFFPLIYQRYVVSRIFNLLVRISLIKVLRDTQCGIKGFNTRRAREIMQKMTIFNFAFDVELLHIAQHNGLKIVQVPVTFDYIDEPSSVRLLKDSFIMLRSLFRIKINSLGTKYLIDIPGGHPEDGS
jgi:dolichyl-phosphate beta-glucosyltransferase